MTTHPTPRRRRPARRRGPAAWPRWWRSSSLAVVMLRAVRCRALNAFKSPARLRRERPAELPTEFYTDGLVNFWDRVDFGRKLLEHVLISGSVAVLGGAALAAQRLRARHRPGAGAGSGSSCCFLLANMLPQEALVYPLYYLAKEVGLYDTQLVGDHHLHRDPERRSAPTCSSSVLRHVPQGAARGGRASTARAAGRSCGGSSSRSAGRPCRCC